MGKVKQKLGLTNLTDEQELFCHTIAYGPHMGDGITSYAIAYKKELPKDYLACKTSSHRLLTNVAVLARVNELMEQSMNDQRADLELNYIMLQKNDLNAKNKAIELYSKLKGRIINKLEGDLTITWKDNTDEE